MSLTQFSRVGNYIIGSYKTVIYGRSNWLNTTQICNYTRRSAEAKLGIDKPKRPLTPFFKFMVQMRPALLAKHPGITSKEAIAWSSKHWQQLDVETKTQMFKEFEKDMEDYKKIKTIYEDSLTETQKEDIKRVKAEMAASKEKRKLKAEVADLGKPKRPMTSYILFSQTKKDFIKGRSLTEFQKIMKEEWANISDTEKAKYEKQSKELYEKYRKELQAWELKMVTIGRPDLVRATARRSEKNIVDKKNKK